MNKINLKYLLCSQKQTLIIAIIYFHYFLILTGDMSINKLNNSTLKNTSFKFFPVVFLIFSCYLPVIFPDISPVIFKTILYLILVNIFLKNMLSGIYMIRNSGTTIHHPWIA